MHAKVDDTLSCPSAQPGMADIQVLGIATGALDGPGSHTSISTCPLLPRSWVLLLPSSQPRCCASPQSAQHRSACTLMVANVTS